MEVDDSKLQTCASGADRGPLLLLIGDSHAAQWHSALSELAKERNLRLVSMTKSSCPFIEGTVQLDSRDRPYTACKEWNDNLRDYIAAEKPAAVVTSTLSTYTMSGATSGPKDFTMSVSEAWSWANAQGVPVISIVDTPYMATSVPGCLAENPQQPQSCATPSASALAGSGLEQEAASGLQKVFVLDMTDLICPGATCQPIIGNVLVYRDQHHLSDSYVRSLTTHLSSRFPAVAALDGQSPANTMID